jgi:hypothetical protein
MKIPTSLLVVAMLVAMVTVTHGFRGCTVSNLFLKNEISNNGIDNTMLTCLMMQ